MDTARFGLDIASACAAAREADGGILVWVHLDY